MYAKARELMPGGQSHNARFFDPYPFFAAKAKGKYLWDIDGNRYVDYWMGHTALILGHSPRSGRERDQESSGTGSAVWQPQQVCAGTRGTGERNRPVRRDDSLLHDR